MKISPGPTIIMMCGLQGSGKTTTCGKLAAYLKKRGRSVMLAAADLQRPAAVEQLHTLSEQVQKEMPGGSQVHFYSEPDKIAAYGKAVGVAVQVCRSVPSPSPREKASMSSSSTPRAVCTSTTHSWASSSRSTAPSTPSTSSSSPTR